MSIKHKLCIVAALYRSPSQPHSEFTNFSTSLELTLHAMASTNSFLSLVLGDFNLKKKPSLIRTIPGLKELQLMT